MSESGAARVAKEVEEIELCEVRELCLTPKLLEGEKYRCGFEIANSMAACWKFRRLTAEG